MTTERIKTLRNNVVGQIPIVSIQRPLYYTQSMMSSEKEPMVIRQAKALSSVLKKMEIRILPGELIVGVPFEKVPGATIYPEAHGTRIITELEDLAEREKHEFTITDADIACLKEEVNPYWEERSLLAYADEKGEQEVLDVLYTGAAFLLTEMAGYGHVSINYPKLLSIGFQKFIEQADLRIHAIENKSDIESVMKRDFYEASIIVSKSIINFAKRYAELARELAGKEESSERKKELENISDICSRIPANPPDSFYEAIQFIRFVQLALSLETYDGQAISLGRIDQYLLPFYESDRKSGKIDEEYAKELIQCLWIKINEHVPIFDSLVGMYFEGLLSTQAATIGGVDKNGDDATNKLTYIILDATKAVALPLPNVHVRINENSPTELMHRLSDVISSGVNNVAVFSDEVIVESLMKRQIPTEEARNYSTVGCVEIAPFGNSFTSSDAALFNLPFCLELVLTNGYSSMLNEKIGIETGNPSEFKSIEDVISAYKKQVSHFVKLMVTGSNCLEEGNKNLKPTPFLSLCVDECFDIGKDITAGSARYNFTGVQGVGMSDVADSLAALDLLVFRESKVTIAELLDALKTNFDGFEDLRNLLLNKAPKFGNDNELVDKYAELVATHYSNEITSYNNVRHGTFIPGMYSVSTHIPFGIMTGALPSGRYEGMPLSNGASPALGNSRNGMTATIKSVSKIDYTQYANGIAFTLNVDPSLLKDSNDANYLTALMKSYFKLGGMQIQFNVLKQEDLISAQSNPEKYRDLLVRVAGYSAYFVDMAKEAQDEVIGRFQAR